MPSQLFARDASNLCNSSDAGGELDLRKKAKPCVRYSLEEASTAVPVVLAGRVENHSKLAVFGPRRGIDDPWHEHIAHCYPCHIELRTLFRAHQPPDPS